MRGVCSRKPEPGVTSGLATRRTQEHTWCDSHGLRVVEPAYNDPHNLRAEAISLNSSRGSKFYDASDTNNCSYRMPAHAEAPLASTDTDS